MKRLLTIVAVTLFIPSIALSQENRNPQSNFDQEVAQVQVQLQTQNQMLNNENPQQQMIQQNRMNPLQMVQQQSNPMNAENTSSTNGTGSNLALPTLESGSSLSIDAPDIELGDSEASSRNKRNKHHLRKAWRHTARWFRYKLGRSIRYSFSVDCFF